MSILSVVFALALLNYCQGANILAIFPTPSISHQVVYRALAQDLIARGHHLTILTPSPVTDGENANVTEIDLSATVQLFHELFNFAEFRDVRNDEIGFVRKASVIFERVMNEQLSHPRVQELINGRGKYHFDLMIMEHTGYIPMLAFAEIYDCPVVGITSFEAPDFTYQMFGNEANIIVHPEQNIPYPNGERTFVERWKILKSNFMMILAVLLPPFPLQTMSNVLSTHFPEVKRGVFGLIERVELLMVNVHPAMGFVRPLVPRTIQLGFMHIVPPKPLEEGELKKFLDKSEHGVIYMSFGSNILSKDLGERAIGIFLNVFRSIKYDVVWKFEGEELPKHPKYIMTQKWLPQADLLAHPKIKLFITQGGQQSVEEAIDRTVPMIVIPFLGDQPGMAAKLEQKGVARYIDFDNITERHLFESIEEMTGEKYKENIRILREQVYDTPMTSREKAVWWTEYVLRHKGMKHLDYHGRLVPIYQKYCLDFIAIGVFLIYVFLKLLKYILSLPFKAKVKLE